MAAAQRMRKTPLPSKVIPEDPLSLSDAAGKSTDNRPQTARQTTPPTQIRAPANPRTRPDAVAGSLRASGGRRGLFAVLLHQLIQVDVKILADGDQLITLRDRDTRLPF